jgi:protein-S-isoprenylcysteine O-methyltransferase Ste14
VQAAFERQPVASALFTATALIWVIGELFQAVRRRPNAAHDDRYSLLLIRVGITAAMVLAGFSAARVAATAIPPSTARFAISLVLIWCGMGLRVWCFLTLGRYFTFTVMTSADQPVIATGPYARLRHPSYTGLVLALAGIGLYFGNWLSLLALIVLPLAAIIYRIYVEESALTIAFGQAYANYASSRKRLIPFVW